MNIFCHLWTILVFLLDVETKRFFNRENESVDAICIWFCANTLSLNASKTHYMVIQPPNKKRDYQHTNLNIDKLNEVWSKVPPL